ncbi:MAG: hypothetical protein EPO68_02060 [Planctomycetota bacterium]|nr:MAG: hypothetical protein EPO68_02060 [Planctomycetota bacterium]
MNRRTSESVLGALALLALSSCGELAPNLRQREATSASELARLSADARTIELLTLSGRGITDAALARVEPLTAVRTIVMLDCDEASAAGLEPLAKLRELRELVLYDCARLEGAALEPLQRCAKLETVRLHAKSVDAATLEQLARCKRLRSLRLTGSLAPDAEAALAALRTALPDCIVVAAK